MCSLNRLLLHGNSLQSRVISDKTLNFFQNSEVKTKQMKKKKEKE